MALKPFNYSRRNPDGGYIMQLVSKQISQVLSVLLLLSYGFAGNAQEFYRLVDASWY